MTAFDPHVIWPTNEVRRHIYICMTGKKTLMEKNMRNIFKMLKRVLDDIFMTWRVSLGDPSDLLREMNSLDPKISSLCNPVIQIPSSFSVLL